MKKFLFVAVLSLAAMFSFSSCEKDPDGNGGDNVGKSKPLKSFVWGVIDDTSYDYQFVNDEKGRIIKSVEKTDWDEVETTIKYGPNEINVLSEGKYEKKNIDYVLENGKVVRSSYKIYTRQGETYDYELQSDGDMTYSYDASGYLTDVEKNEAGYITRTKLEWENGCLMSWYEESFNLDNELSFRNKEVFYYGDTMANISNLSPFQRSLESITDWDFEYIYNLLGQTPKYLPVKQETRTGSYHNCKPGDPDDTFDTMLKVTTFDYTFNEDKTVSEAHFEMKMGETDYKIQFYYKFGY